MAYIKTIWVNNSTKLNADNMNHIEDGIEANDVLLASVVTSIATITAFLDTLSFIHDMTKKLNLKKKQNLPISPSQKKVNDIIAFLQDHLSENINIPEISAHFYLNPDYLARLFKSHMHISIDRYISLQKISAAEGMLRNGCTVSEVQEALGYSSYAYFFKNFQKITGMSPSKYRSQYTIK